MYSIILLLIATLFTIGLIRRQSRDADERRITFRKQRKIEKLWDNTQRYIRENKLIQAEKSLLAILILDKENASAYTRIGILYAKQKEYKDAIDCLMTACNLAKTPSALHNLGIVYFSTGDYEKASIVFKEALQMDNKSHIRYITYAKVLERLGHNKEMLEILEKAADLGPNLEILNILKKIYISRNMMDKLEEVEKRINTLIMPTPRSHHLQQHKTTPG